MLVYRLPYILKFSICFKQAVCASITMTLGFTTVTTNSCPEGIFLFVTNFMSSNLQYLWITPHVVLTGFTSFPVLSEVF